jgi:hypothetical protein
MSSRVLVHNKMYNLEVAVESPSTRSTQAGMTRCRSAPVGVRAITLRGSCSCSCSGEKRGWATKSGY